MLTRPGEGPPATAVRVVIADPSAVARARLAAALTDSPSATFEVADRVATGPEAVAAVVRQQPGLALLAPDLPQLDTLHVVRQIMAGQPTPLLVLAVSPLESKVASGLVRAGALDVLARPPDTGDDGVWRAFGGELRAHARLLAGIRVIRHVSGRGEAEARRRADSGVFGPAVGAGGSSPAPGARLPVYLGIVASTGGPPAVATVLRELPRRVPAAVLLVQHIGSSFADSLVEWLGRESPLPVHLARDGAVPHLGHVYVAPGHAHLLLRGGRLRLDNGPPRNHLRPCGDLLLLSLAEEAALRSVGVVLTGIGSDGAEGLLALRRAGGWTIAQDQTTSAVWGMPQAALQANAACEVLSLPAIGRRLRELLTAGRAPDPPAPP